MSGTSRRGVGAILLLALAAALAHLRALVSSGTYFYGDLGDHYLPLHLATRDFIRTGRWPLWLPDLIGGMALHADGLAGILYPLNLLLRLPALPIAVALEATLWLHSAIGAFGVYWLARGCGRSRGAATMAGALFALSGYATARIVHLPMLQAAVWLPIQIGCLQRAQHARGRERALWLLALAGVSGLAALVFHPPQTFVSGVALLIWAIFDPGLPRRWLARWGPLALAAAGAMLLSAVQWLPTLELARESPRLTTPEYRWLMQFSLPPWQLPMLLLPNLFGSPATGDYWGAPNHWELNGFVGLATLLLAAAGAGSARREASGRAAVALTAIGLALALGPYFPLSRALVLLPGFGTFRAPGRWLLLFTLGVILLAAWGGDRLRAAPPPRWLGRVAAAIAAGALLLALALPTLRPQLVRHVTPAVVARYRPTGPTEAWSARLDRYVRHRATDFAWLALLGAGAVLVLRGRGAMRFGGLAVLAAADLVRFSLGYWPIWPAEYHTRPGPLARAIAADGSRVWLDDFAAWERALTAGRPGWAGGSEVAFARRAALPWNTPAAHRIAAGHSGAGLPPTRTLRLSEAIHARWPGVGTALRRLGFAYAITPRGLPDGWHPLATFAGLTLARCDDDPPPRPRAAFAAAWESVPDAESALARLFAAPPDVAIVEGALALPIAPPVAGDVIRWRRDEPTAREVEAIVAGPRLVLFTDRWAPGWHATVDGRPATIRRAEYWGAAVTIPAGRHRIAWRYRPASVEAGGFLSLAALGAGIGLLTALGRPHRGKGAPPPDAGSRPR